MKLTSGMCLAAALAFGFCIETHSTLAGDDFTPEPGYTGLFNGKDLTGWRQGKDVTNGAIVIDGGGGGDIYSVQDLSIGAVAECKCNGEVIEKILKVGVGGGIGLQSETGKFEFRRIRIKELP